MTVKGPVRISKMGTTLVHEHILVDFVGAEQSGPHRYNASEVIRVVEPYLKEARKCGCCTFLECTPAYLGRDPVLLAKLAELTGLNIVTNTGYYAAGMEKYLPRHAFSESADQLAACWLREWREGIGATGIKPGFIKIGVDAGALSAIARKLVQAACRTHLQSGLTIAAHTGNGTAALAQLEVLADEGVQGCAFVWVHAQNEQDSRIHVRAARAGAWIEFDGIAPQTIDRHIQLVNTMKAHGLLHRVLISQDAGWYHVGEPGGGKYRPYTTIFNQFIPALKAAGVTEEEIQQIMVINPREAFASRVRRSK
ncbi:MAG: aryldialkylphosphatase [Gemmataceae bacterium]